MRFESHTQNRARNKTNTYPGRGGTILEKKSCYPFTKEGSFAMKANASFFLRSSYGGGTNIVWAIFNEVVHKRLAFVKTSSAVFCVSRFFFSDVEPGCRDKED